MIRMLSIAGLVLLVAAPLVAHEGHDHRVMGTVSVIHENHLEVKEAKTGKTSTITLNDKTKILRGADAVRAVDIKAGDRVVVTAVTQKDKAGKEMLVAKEVRLGTATSSGAQQ
jgi:hypothetical protein